MILREISRVLLGVGGLENLEFFQGVMLRICFEIIKEKRRLTINELLDRGRE